MDKSRSLGKRFNQQQWKKEKGFLKHLYLKIDKRGFINTYEIKTS